ncbi:MAG TPA: ATP-dependent helicase HrpB [Steroidobacteraceae bacterium]
MKLPAEIDAHPLVRSLRGALHNHRDLVLQAPPGAGKSTVVPLALLGEEWLAGRRLLLLEPRRIAARAVARRMARTLGEEAGATVGYRMRQETRVSAATRIEVITEGVLTRMLQSDPELPGVGAVIFDEFHERSLNADLGLALCLDARRELAASFRILVMSATLDGVKVVGLLENARLIEVPGRAHPVEIVYAGRGAPLLPGGAEWPEQAVARQILKVLDEPGGDILVFLPGGGEIRRVQRFLQERGVPPDVKLAALYGDLSSRDQDAALEPDPRGARKIVLATNIAETSLTIPAVTVVIDSGLVRRLRFDPVTGMSRLQVMRVSRASAEQRAGRAGRIAPGKCYRLWSEGAHNSLAAHTPPEIAEADLASLALELAAWGVDDVQRLAWLDAPPTAALAQARDLLMRLDALDERDRITPIGREMASFPVHPRLAHMLRVAPGLGAIRLAAQLAALLSDRDPLRAGRDPDLRTRVDALERNADIKGMDPGAVQRIRQSADQLARLAAAGQDHDSKADDVKGCSPGQLLACAFPDRIGQRRDGAAGRYLLTNGRGAAFADKSALGQPEFIVAVELDDADREARIDLAASLTRAELEQMMAAHIRTSESVSWDARAGAVLARRVARLDALVLEDKPLTDVPAELTAGAMFAGVQQLGLASLPWDPATRNLQARLEFVRSLTRTDLGDWPASDDDSLQASAAEWLTPWLAGMTRREHMAKLSLTEALLARLTRVQRRQLEALAPPEWVAPTGSFIAIDYLDDSAPCLSVRLQEVFGLADTPRIGGGTMPVTLKLLSPARRPVQVTRDLAGFWGGSYAQVRKDMRGRYPKHYWPENPLQAKPQRGVKRR